MLTCNNLDGSSARNFNQSGLERPASWIWETRQGWGTVLDDSIGSIGETLDVLQ